MRCDRMAGADHSQHREVLTMTDNATTTATTQTASDKGIVSEAIGRIDKVRWLLALLDDVTDHAEEIHLEGDAVIGFKQAMLDARNELQDARESLEQICYSVPRLSRAIGRVS